MQVAETLEPGPFASPGRPESATSLNDHDAAAEAGDDEQDGVSDSELGPGRTPVRVNQLHMHEPFIGFDSVKLVIAYFSLD